MEFLESFHDLVLTLRSHRSSLEIKRSILSYYVGTEVFRAMSDLLVRLRSAPIIPSFDPNKDRKYLAKIRKECMTDSRIETPVHRVVLIGHE